MFKRIYLHLALLPALLTPALAQGKATLRGRIVAEADGSALNEIRLELESQALPQPLQSSSDADGYFQFQGLMPGDYSLAARHPSFATRDIRLTLKPREVRNLTIPLEIRPSDVTVDVMAETVSMASTYSPSSTVLGQTHLGDLPLTQQTSLPDALVTAAPGMIRGHDDFVHIRGQELALNTFINGVSFWENPHSLFSGGLSPRVISSANVMTGGFSAEYGNRFGGIVDVVTKSGLSMNDEGSLTLGLGSALRHNVAAEYGGHAGNVGYYLFTSGSESARFLSPPDPRAIHDTGRGAHSFLQLDFLVSANDTLKVIFMGDGSNFEIPKTPLDDDIRPNANAFQRTRQQTAILSWDRAFSAETLLNTSIYQRWSRSQLLPALDPLAATARSRRDLMTAGVKSDLTRFAGRHTLKGGVDFVVLRPHEELSYEYEGYRRLTHELNLPHLHFSQPIQFDQRKTGGQLSLYLQDAIQVTPSLTADLGLRFDRYSLALSESHFSPRFNFAYRLDESGAVLHASYNHFFVPPPVENVLLSSAGLTRFIREIGEGLSPLRPTVEDQFELGVIQPVGSDLRLGLTGYYRLSDNPVHTAIWPDSRIYSYASFDRAQAYGLEFKAEAPLIRRLGLSGYLNYARGQVYFYNPVTAGFISEVHHIEETGRFLAPMDQTHTATAGVTYRHARSGAWVGLTSEYGSGTPVGHGEDAGHDHGHHDHPGEEQDHESQAMPAAGRVPPHLTLNLSAGFELFRSGDRARLSLQFNVENLTDNVYIIAQESVFSPGQFYIPRLFSASARFYFW
ncbi:MAG: TonB-dependent receptor [Acidobacteriota bacterium]